MKEALKIVFLGTPEFAVDSLDILANNGFDIAAVVTSPDQPAGRGQLLQSSPIKKYAQSKGIRVLQPEKLKNPEFITELQSLQGDLFIVVAFRMLPEVVWAMPRLGTFNLHASLLPQYRGAAPINHAIMNGETETGLTTFFLKQEIDTGEIIFQEKIAIGPDETAGELHDRMKVAGALLVLKTTRAIQEGNLQPVEQGKLIDPANPLKPAPKIFREDCLIDWSNDTVSIFNRIRGLSPYPAAHTFFISPEGESYMVKIYRAEKAGTISGFNSGCIITDGKTGLSITTTNGSIHIRALQQAGKKVLSIDEFLRGFRINSDWIAGQSSE
jgi:methionyl-tRNA formyltransferase